MKIIVASRDCTATLGAAVRAAVDRHPSAARPPAVPPEISALSLREARDEADYQKRFVRLMRVRDNVDTFPFRIPRRPGLLGALLAPVRRCQWKVLRFLLDRLAFRQNLINNLFTNAVEWELLRRRSEIERLERRVAALETRLGAAPDNAPGGATEPR